MIILGICLSLIVIGILVTNYADFEPIGVLGIIIGGTCLIIALITLPISFYSIKAEIKAFQSVKQTVEIARKEASEIEKAALQHKIIESNKWLASYQYWNETSFDIWIPDDIMSLKPLQ